MTATTTATVRRALRRALGALLVVITAAAGLTGCGPARGEPTPEALETASELVAQLSRIELLSEVSSGVTMHLYTPPVIGAVMETTAEPDRAQLARIVTAVQDAVDTHQLPGHEITVTLRSTVGGAELNWGWGPSAASDPTVDQQLDAAFGERVRGATSVTIERDRVSSHWESIDGATALHETPDGMRQAFRWLTAGSAQSMTVTVNAGEPALDWPLAELVAEPRPYLDAADIVVRDGTASWHLTLDIDDDTAGAFADAMVTMLRGLRDVDRTAANTAANAVTIAVTCTGPWWVTFAIDDTVTVQGWHSDADRERNERAITALLARVNA